MSGPSCQEKPNHFRSSIIAAYEFRFGACRIQIFIAQNKYTVALARALLRSPKGSRVTEVKIARRRWCDASAINHAASAFAISAQPLAELWQREGKKLLNFAAIQRRVRRTLHAGIVAK